jgi:hypothetical protein
VWIPVSAEGPVLQRLLATGWVAQPGETYRLSSPPAIRLSIGALSSEQMPALAGAVADAMTARSTTRLG